MFPLCRSDIFKYSVTITPTPPQLDAGNGHFLVSIFSLSLSRCRLAKRFAIQTSFFGQTIIFCICANCSPTHFTFALPPLRENACVFSGPNVPQFSIRVFFPLHCDRKLVRIHIGVPLMFHTIFDARFDVTSRHIWFDLFLSIKMNEFLLFTLTHLRLIGFAFLDEESIGGSGGRIPIFEQFPANFSP